MLQKQQTIEENNGKINQNNKCGSVKLMNITKDIRYIGVNDHNIDLFEGQYHVPNGMSYNSYVILDEKIAVMDTNSLSINYN